MAAAKSVGHAPTLAQSAGAPARLPSRLLYPQVALQVDGQCVGYSKLFSLPTSQTFEGFLEAGGAPAAG